MALLHVVALSILIQILGWYGIDAQPATPKTEAWAQAMGAKADLDILWVQTHEINGGFIKPQRVCAFMQCFDLTRPAIVLFTPTEDSLTTLTILSHEVGHYHQWRLGGMNDYLESPMNYEWDADVRGADQLCAMHYDGVTMMGQLLLNMGVSDEEDRTHGGSWARATNVGLNGCKAVVQS